jgi:hypothetical protein
MDTVLIDRYKSWAWAVVTMRIENEMSEEQLHIAVDFCPSGTSVCANWEVQGRRRSLGNDERVPVTYVSCRYYHWHIS